jgi:hypothetical protein
MAIFLKIVSGVYLTFVWLVFFITMNAPLPPVLGLGGPIIVFLFTVLLSIPAVALFAFGQIVGDIRVMRHLAKRQADDLQAMRRYYEPR